MRAQRGFTLIEVLVAMLLLGLVGLAALRFQTMQVVGSARLAATALARLEADNLVVDMQASPPPARALEGISHNGGRDWYWRIVPGPSPWPAAHPELVTLDIAVAAEAGGTPLARRHLVKYRTP